MFKKFDSEQFDKLNNYQRNRYIDHVKRNMSIKDKLAIIDFASKSEQGTKELIIRLYNSISKKIIKFFNSEKTDYCYVHFSFLTNSINNSPTIIIDQDINSHPNMYCIKYRKFI